jgi:hypothetical protein
MSFARKTLLLALSTAALAAGINACKTVDDTEEAEADVANLTEQELATKALQILGARQTPRPNGEPGSCSFTGCHSINRRKLQEWNESYLSGMQILDGRESQTERINKMRANPRSDRTRFAPTRIGIMAAGAHLGLGATVDPTRHPETYKQGQKFAQLFAGKEDVYETFKKQMLMPVLPQFPRLTPTEFETVLTWFKKGMPKLDEIVQESRPRTCEDNFGPLKARTSEVKTKTWAAVNKARALPMMGCPAPNPADPVSPTECFKQQKDGKDIFPKDLPMQAGWGQDGAVVRILRELSAPNSYWMRTSADGRFSATGGSVASDNNNQGGGAQAVDHQATLEGHKRDISLAAEYDPDFWPDNKAFMFQGGTKFCAQSLLEKPATRSVNFGEPECSSLSAAEGLYQTVGQTIGDNSLSDRFILYSIWAGDEGQYTSEASDTPPAAGDDSAVQIYTAVAVGNDVEEGYKIRGDAFHIDTPYRGDTMMGRSGRLLGSRWAYEDQATQHGYAIEKLDWTISNGKYNFELSPLGNVCLKGNKANFSFDERFLATHHYNDHEDLRDASQAYKDKGSSDVWMVDFVTGKKQQVTKMGPGQFALYAHFRSDGWLYFLVVDANTDKYYVAATDWAVRQTEITPTP